MYPASPLVRPQLCTHARTISTRGRMPCCFVFDSVIVVVLSEVSATGDAPRSSALVNAGLRQDANGGVDESRDHGGRIGTTRPLRAW
jgi:hypothetical protein